MPEKSTPRRRCAQCELMRAETSFVGPRGRLCKVCRSANRRKGSHATRVKRTYELRDGEYEAILERQEGVCGGCHQPRQYNLHVDHDHKVEREEGTRASVRGLLCARCNTVLRKVRDDAAVLRGLARYLDDPPAHEVILEDD